jgi:type II secretory pathway pseudopilin PulG
MGNRRAHSLVELLIVIGVIALVMAIIVTTFAKVYRVIEGWR